MDLSSGNKSTSKHSAETHLCTLQIWDLNTQICLKPVICYQCNQSPHQLAPSTGIITHIHSFVCLNSCQLLKDCKVMEERTGHDHPLTAEGPFDLWLLTTTDPSVNPPGSFSTKSRLTPHFCRTKLYARVKLSSIRGSTANFGRSLWSVEQKPAFLIPETGAMLYFSLWVCTWGLLLRKKKRKRAFCAFCEAWTRSVHECCTSLQSASVGEQQTLCCAAPTSHCAPL